MGRVHIRNQFLIFSFALVFAFGFSFDAQAKRKFKPSFEDITPENVDQLYNEALQRYQEILATTPQRTLIKFRHSKGSHLKKMTKSQARLKKEFESVRDEKERLEPMVLLRNDMVKLYKETHKKSSYDQEALFKESTSLSVGLIKEIERLRHKYKSIFIPIVHNMMIDIGVRKRGACKHWAEDLLEYMRPIPRQFFYVAWGESWAGQFTEHNVAVVVPKGKQFDDGMMIDPWRTSGKPFWIKLKDDGHYEWKHWADFGVF